MGDITPKYRIEQFIDAIINGTTPPTPKYRAEFWLAKIAGANVVPPTPRSRFEKYLAKIAGENINIPTPKYRAEFWLAKIAGEDVTTPTPRDRLEQFLEEWKEASEQPEPEIILGVQKFQGLAGDASLPNCIKGEPFKELVAYGSIRQGTLEQLDIGGVTVNYCPVVAEGRILTASLDGFTTTDPPAEVRIENTDQAVSMELLLSTTYYRTGGGITDSHDILNGTVTKRCGVKVFNGTESWEDHADGPRVVLSGAKQGYSGTLVTAFGEFPNQSMPYFQFPSALMPGISAAMVQQMTAYMASMGKPSFVIYPLETPITSSVAPQTMTVPVDLAGTPLVRVYTPNGKYPVAFDVGYLLEAVAPTNWEKIKYLESDGTDGYIDLDDVQSELQNYEIGDEIILDVQFTDTASSSPKMACGYMGSNSSLPRWGVGVYQNKWLASANNTTSVGVADTERHVFVLKTRDVSGTPMYSVTMDGEDIITERAIPEPDEFLANTLDMYLFARNNNGTAGNFAACKIYKYAIKTDDNYYKTYFIPIKRNISYRVYECVTGSHRYDVGNITGG